MSARADISPVALLQARIAVALCISLVFLGGDKLVYRYRPALDLAVCGLALVLLLPVLARAVLDVWPILFATWCAGSILWSVDGFSTQRQVVFTLPIFFVLQLGASALGTKRAMDAFRIATQVVIALTVLYVARYGGAAWIPAVDGAQGFRGAFGHKNGTGFFFSLTGIAWLPRRRDATGRVMLLIAAIGVLLSQSSTALVLLLGGTAIYALLWRHFTRSAPGARATRSIIAVMAALGMLLIVVEYLDAATSLIGRDVTLTGRVDIWQAVIPRVKEHLLRGVGYGAPWTAITSFNAPIFREIHFRPYHAHNGYLDTLLQIGTVGLVLLLGLWFIAIRRCARAEGHLGDVVAVLTMLVMLLIAGGSETAPLLEAGLAVVGYLGGAAARTDVAPTAAARSFVAPLHRRRVADAVR